MDDFRGVLIILGAISILALAAHGIWTVKRKAKLQRDNQRRPSASKKNTAKKSVDKPLENKNANSGVSKERVEPNFTSAKIEPELPDEGIVVSIDKSRTEKSTATANVEAPSAPVEKIDVSDINNEIGLDNSAADTIAPSEPADVKENHDPEEVLILNVVAPEGQVISGAALLPLLLTLGFKFGDMAIFHRHEDSAGGGEVLFSLANMFNPGTFDIDNMETYTTQGISLFMSLPVDGDPSQVFNMMHNAAKKVATEFNGQVLDGQRSVLTRQTVQHYLDRIREFERRQLLKA